MKKTILILLIFSHWLVLNAQTISRQIVSSNGIQSSNIEWTLGELITDHYQGNESTLSQGFHQGNLVLTMIYETKDKINIKVYPNPTISHIVIATLNKRDLNAKIFDIDGKLILSRDITGSTTEINVEGFAAGTYFLSLTKSNQIIKTIKVQKLD